MSFVHIATGSGAAVAMIFASLPSALERAISSDRGDGGAARFGEGLGVEDEERLPGFRLRPLDEAEGVLDLEQALEQSEAS